MKKSEPFEVHLIDGTTESVTVREIRVDEYPKALRFDDEDNEAEILSIACDRHPGWAVKLEPGSYAEAIAKFQEIDQHFFARAVRRQTRRAVRDVVSNAAGIGSSRGGSMSRS